MSIKRLIKRSMPGLASLLRRNGAFCALRANRLARTSKRLDVCASQLAQLLHLAGPPYLEGKTCLEIGSGWVLSHSLALHLLGARAVLATDLDAIARLASLRVAAGASIQYLVRDALAPFSNHQAVRTRLENFLAAGKTSLGELERLGIRYRAPLDLARQRVGQSFDFALSFSVMEHVISRDVSALLENLWSDLSPGGRMIHCIHMEDHLDFEQDPFAFLGCGDEALAPAFEAGRGNRIRASEWLRLLGSLPGARVRTLYQYRRTDRPLPANISPRVPHAGEDDLRTSHLGVMVEKAV